MSAPVQYDKLGRMQYHPDYHPKHQKPWSNADEKYLIDNYALDGPEAVSFTLGRTIHVVMTRAYQLRKEGKMAKYDPKAPKHERMRAECKKKWKESL